MDLHLDVRYWTNHDSWLCFRHAVTEAMAGKHVTVEINDFRDEHYMGRTSCLKCEDE